MTARIQTNRFTTTGSRPPSTRPVGELAINFADNQLSVTDPTPAARDILPIRFHSATAAYLVNDIVRQGTGLYQAKANTPAHAFNATEWNQFLTNVAGDARWLPLAGGTLTGLLTLSGPPTSNLHAATKFYVDTADLTKVPLAGGTMTGFLTLSGAPASNLHAVTKAYADLMLPLAGGIVTGSLGVGVAPPAGGFTPVAYANLFSSAGTGLSISAYLNVGAASWMRWGTTFAPTVLEPTATGLNIAVAFPGADGSAIAAFSFYQFGANGTLTLPGGIRYAGVDTDNSFSFNWTGSNADLYIDGVKQGTLALVSAVNAAFLPLTGGTLSGSLAINTGTLSVQGTIGSNGLIAALGDIYARGGHYYFGAADQAVLNTTAAGTSLRFSSDGWALSWGATSGTLAFFNNTALALFTVDGAGNGSFLGTVHGSNVTLLEDQINALQARIAALEGASP